ncbi:hypothetical protein P8452_50633 [Trifolium repens]|nr:hypothetical protein P8452_50633 [Trifolium repens]
MPSHHRHEKPNVGQRSTTVDRKDRSTIKVSILRVRKGFPFLFHPQEKRKIRMEYPMRRGIPKVKNIPRLATNPHSPRERKYSLPISRRLGQSAYLRISSRNKRRREACLLRQQDVQRRRGKVPKD